MKKGKLKTKKERPAIIGEFIGRIIVGGLTFCILVAVVALVVLTCWGFVNLMKGVFNGF